MQPLFTYLRSVVVPTGVFAATDDFGAGPGGADLSARIRRAASEPCCEMFAERVALPGYAEREEDTRKRLSGNALDATAVTPFAERRGHSG